MERREGQRGAEPDSGGIGPNDAAPIVMAPMPIDVSAEEMVRAPAETARLGAGQHIHDSARTGEIRTGRLAGLSMGAAIWTLSWPVVCESLLNSTVAAVDTYLASHESQAAADAVAGGAYVIWFMGLIVMAIGVGATALVSRAIGAGRRAVARAALGQAMTLAAIGGLAVGAGVVLLAGTLADLTRMHGQSAEDFKHYLWAYGFGIPCSTIMFAGTACARGAGDTVRPLITMLVVNIVNYAVARTLVSAGMGVRGIGIGTGCAHLVGAIMIVTFHARGASGVHLLWRWMKPHWVTTYRLLRLGLPNFFETLGMYIVNFAVLIMVGWMSDAAIAAGGPGVVGESSGLQGAHLWAIRIEAFSFMPGFSMGIAAGALAGQYLGAGSPEKARRAATICALAGAAIMGTLGLVFITLGGPIMRMLSDQPAHQEYTPRLLFITGLTQVPFALSLVLRSAMHGAGDVRAVMVMTWISQWGLRLPLAYFFSGVDVPLPQWLGGGVLVNPSPFDLGLVGLWIGLCTEIVLRCLIYGWRFLSGKWLLARV